LEFLDTLRRRRTTNGPFLPDPVKPEHQRLLMEVASRAPSHFNSQPWRFVLIDDREIIEEIARISGESMTRLMEEGTFWKRYRPYFRFSEREMEERRDGIFIDQMPSVLKPFRKQIFSGTGQAIMNRFGVPKTLGEDNRKLVAGSPLLLAVLLDKAEYRPGELSGFYSLFGMGAAVENIWLTTTEIGMGIQFISTPMEIPENWRRIERLIDKPDDLELMAVYRLGYVPPDQRRPTIDWSSSQRKRLSQYVFRNSCKEPETDAEPAKSAPPDAGSPAPDPRPVER
jgi:nitroreductase